MQFQRVHRDSLPKLYLPSPKGHLFASISSHPSQQHREHLQYGHQTGCILTLNGFYKVVFVIHTLMWAFFCLLFILKAQLDNRTVSCSNQHVFLKYWACLLQRAVLVHSSTQRLRSQSTLWNTANKSLYHVMKLHQGQGKILILNKSFYHTSR